MPRRRCAYFIYNKNKRFPYKCLCCSEFCILWKRRLVSHPFLLLSIIWLENPREMPCPDRNLVLSIEIFSSVTFSAYPGCTFARHFHQGERRKYSNITHLYGVHKTWLIPASLHIIHVIDVLAVLAKEMATDSLLFVRKHI